MLTEEDGKIIGETALDAIAYVGEHYKTENVKLHAVLVILVFEDDEGVHIAQTVSEI